MPHREVVSLLLVATVLGTLPTPFASAANPKTAPIDVSVEDIGSRVNLIGRLGKPIGAMMTVRGKWHFPSEHVKDYSLRFTVSHVDGQQLDMPIEFNIDQLNVVNKNGSSAIPPLSKHEQLNGTDWTFRAFETGTIRMSPDEYWLEREAHAMPYYFRPFTSELTGILQPQPSQR
jgi:hypothetical protein